MADNEIYDPEEADAEQQQIAAEQASDAAQPLFRIFEGSRIAISKHVGKMWKKRFDAAIKAYEFITEVDEEVFKYYNNSQKKDLETPRGRFTRGDGTENVIYSNTNLVLPAIYGKDPNITCSTEDEADQPMCDALQALLNTLFRRKSAPGINAKPKIKRATGFGVLNNRGIFKLDFTQKDDSRQLAIEEMTRITTELEKTEDLQEVEELYGELAALEENMEVLKPSGPSLSNVLPQNLLIDPYAESYDATDSQWMIEKVQINTAALIARYTKAEEDSDDEDNPTRVLVYKPTHKAKFSGGGDRDSGTGLVMEAASTQDQAIVSHTDDTRLAYLSMYFTECYYVWDAAMRRVMLFHRDDWTWPLWVWDDPLGLSRFFPYFIISFGFSTGGAVSVGETAYYLDQQDDINDMNRQMNQIRRTIYDFFYYDLDSVDDTDIEPFLKSLRGDSTGKVKKIVGVRAGGKKLEDLVKAFVPPQLEYEKLFNKQEKLDTINRITNTSDAIRGVQFKTNTTVAAVNTYQDSMRLSIGAKVDVVEDAVGDLANALAELCVKNYSREEVASLIGKRLAAGWVGEMSVEQFNATYNVTIVAGSMEKPNSVFKKKEALEITQAVGQFAKAAPGSTLKIMLKVLQQAFTEIVMKKEDWDAIDQEVQANLSRGVSDGAGGTGDGTQGEGTNLEELARNLPDDVKARVVQMKQQGASDEEILQFIQQQVKRHGTQQRNRRNGSRQQQRQGNGGRQPGA